MSAPDRKSLLDREHRVLSMRRQCALIGIAVGRLSSTEAGQ